MGKISSSEFNQDQIREKRANEAIQIREENSHNLSGFLLDIGCGKGQLDKIFYEKGSWPVGIDISYEYLKEAKKNASHCNFVLYDGIKMPFKEEAFDTIICNDVFEHISYTNANAVMAEAKRVLKNSGKFYISIMNRYEIFEPHWLIPFFTWLPRSLWDSFFPVWMKLFGKSRMIKPGFRYSQNYFPYTKTMAQKLFRKFGLYHIDVTDFYAKEKINDIQYIGSRSTRRIVKVLKKLKLTSLALFIATKLSVLVFLCYKNDFHDSDLLEKL